MRLKRAILVAPLFLIVAAGLVWRFAPLSAKQASRRMTRRAAQWLPPLQAAPIVAA